MRVLRTISSVAVLSVAAFGQGKLEFEVASVKPAAAPNMASPTVNIGVRINGAQVHISSFSLMDYIWYAYRMRDYQVSGPDWLPGARFEVDAKLPAGATRDQAPEMMQNLLAERFGLKVHRTTKELPVYALVVAPGGIKMKESEPDANEGDPSKAAVEVNASGGPGGVKLDYGRGSALNFGNNKFEAHKLTMANLATSLASYVDRPVLDMTGNKARYDFTIELTPEDYRGMLIRSAIHAGVTLPPEALRLLDSVTEESLHSSLRTLGLKLEPRKAPLEVLVVDHINRTPTEN